jgi:hypothetical protein
MSKIPINNIKRNRPFFKFIGNPPFLINQNLVFFDARLNNGMDGIRRDGVTFEKHRAH